MLKAGTEQILHLYCEKHPHIAMIEDSLRASVELLCDCFARGGHLYICGNGGSCADADHIVGELVKTFRIARPLDSAVRDRLSAEGANGAALAQKLQGGLPAFNLGAQTALMTAMINDVGGDEIYAQQVSAYGRPGDMLLGISTSGNSKNICHAGAVARAKGMRTLGFTGKSGGKMEQEFDMILHAQADSTEDVQDQHSTIYHAICAAVEYQFWGN
ncbi:MAG: SIS domain-containing protein [Clostridiaceae bacterium]|nr:SIS domain-containing protein [Clostridiaceae bacterium]